MSEPWHLQERREESAQNLGQPAQEAEVVAGGGEEDVGAVAVTALEEIAAHAVPGLHVAEHRLDRGAALHLPADRLGDPPLGQSGRRGRLRPQLLGHAAELLQRDFQVLDDLGGGLLGWRQAVGVLEALVA